jgi:RimJ/RimL family protein N-acetyltransferase
MSWWFRPDAGDRLNSTGLYSCPTVLEVPERMSAGYSRLEPELMTARLRLTMFVLDDAPYMRAIWAARPGMPPLNQDQAAARLAERIAENEVTGIHCYGMRVRGSDEVFGYCGLVTGRTGLDEPEIAYELIPRMHNFGYATEAAQAVISAARATGRRRLWSTVRAWNIASLRVLEKNAFVRDHSRWDNDGEIVYLRYELQGQQQLSD